MGSPSFKKIVAYVLLRSSLDGRLHDAMIFVMSRLSWFYLRLGEPRVGSQCPSEGLMRVPFVHAARAWLERTPAAGQRAHRLGPSLLARGRKLV